MRMGLLPLPCVAVAVVVAFVAPVAELVRERDCTVSALRVRGNDSLLPVRLPMRS